MEKHTDHIKHKTDKPMMRSKRQQHPIDQHDMLKIINDTLAIEEIHSGAEEIPIQGLGKAERAGAGGDVGDGDDLLERDDLDGRHDDDDVDVAGEHAAEEDGDHDEGPDGAGDEGLFFLLVGRWLGWFLDGFAGGLEMGEDRG